MNILYLEHYAGSTEYGMEYRPYYLSKEWVGKGHSVTIVAASFSHLRSKQPVVNNKPEVEIIENIRYIWMPTRSYNGNGISRIFNIADYLTGIRSLPKILNNEKFDAIIASSTYPFDNFYAHSLAKKWQAVHIYEVHDLWPLSPIELGGYSRHNPVIIATQYAEDNAYTNADAVVSLLPLAKEYMISRGLSENKFYYVPNGIYIYEWTEGLNNYSEYWAVKLAPLKEKKILIGYAGSHGIANALDSLIEAASQLPEYGFVLVGQGPEKERLLSKTENMLLKNVLFLDSVSKKKIPAFLEQMDILYIGLQFQSLFRFGISPNKLMDYMMAGKPIICAIKTGNDIVSEAGCGVSIEPENPLALVKALKELASMDPDTRLQMGLRGKNYVMEKHDYRVLADQFLSIIENSLKNKKRNMSC